MKKDGVFMTEEDGAEVWRCRVRGVVVGIEWSSRGAALAGYEVELRRAEKRVAIATGEPFPRRA